jgi:hypothetical protein
MWSSRAPLPSAHQPVLQLTTADVPVRAPQAFTRVSSSSTTGVPSLAGKQAAGSSLSTCGVMCAHTHPTRMPPQLLSHCVV